MEQIINHLETHPNNSISVEFNGRKKMNPNVATNRYLFTKNSIETGWAGVPQFLKNLKNEGFTSGTKVYLRVPNGTTTKVISEPITLQFSGQATSHNKMQQEMNQNATYQNQTTNYPMYQNGQPHFGMSGGMMGVHPSDSKLEAVTAKYDDLKERYDDLKDQYKDLRSTERQLKEVNNSLKLEVNTAEKHKELAILQANLSQKSFMDSDAMKSLAENLAPVIPQIISGHQPQIGMGSSTSNLSNDKKQFIDFIASSNVEDTDVNFIYKLYKNTMKNEAFAQGLQGLLTQFNII